MTITDKITQATIKFEHKTGRRPVSVYLGSNEMYTLMHEALNRSQAGLPRNDGGCYIHEGMRVYQVCAVTHLACA